MTSSGAPIVLPSGALPFRRQPWRYFLTVAALMGLFYALLYFPYQEGSLPVRALSWYLRRLAQVSGAAIRLFDRRALASGELIQGRFSLRIVLDCAALDAHALFAAAVIAFPSPWRRRAVGLVVGTAVVALVNVARIVTLYVVGVRWPSSFHLLHEEVLQLAIILVTFLTFCGWLVWARPRPRP